MVMGPSKKPKCAHKRITNVDEANSDKDLEHSRKHQQRKKRLYDKLGPRWNEQEIECFYDTFRKYGCDWKKVAVAVRTRSREMIEALYLMNRAYLSLPEGTATVRGLIAMMVDHYDAQMDGTESERESNDVSCIYQKPRKRGNISPGSSKDLLQCQSVSSSDGCLLFLKRKQSAGRAVGKRTPRFPVSYPYRNGGVKNTATANPSDPECENLENTDDEHVAALALTEASQRGGSPQLSRTPCGRGPPEAFGERKHHGDEDSKQLRNVRTIKSLLDTEGAGAVEIHLKASKSSGKRHEGTDVDDYREVCSGTRDDPNPSSSKKGKQISVAHAETAKKRESSSRTQCHPLSASGTSAFYALETLADLSLTASTSDLLPARVAKRVMSVPEGEATSTDYYRHERNRYPSSSARKVLHSGYDTEVPTSKRRRPDAETRTRRISESKPSPEALKRKRKIMPAKMIVEEEGNSPASRSKRGCHGSPLAREQKAASLKSGERAISEMKVARDEAVSSFSHYPEGTNVAVPPPVTKYRSRRKMRKHDESDEQRCSVSSHLKDDVSACLSSRTVRRWCVYEWFYSATDYPWFARNEFVEYLHHAGLGHIPRLTRVEWGVIRSSLGKPRRFSERFLEEEKDKVRQYREAVRKHYTELRAGVCDGLPTDLARPLSVGQRVIAVHPKSRDIHDGSVLTVDHDKCRIQFDRPELGVEFVMDVDCMPANPLENMPESIKRQKASLMKFPLSMVTPVDTMAGSSSNSTTALAGGAPLPAGELDRADLQSLTELNWALDKKELLLVELREANDGMVKGKRNGDLLQWKESQLFKKHYATILVELKEASNQVSSAVRKLRDRNTYHPLLRHSHPSLCNGHHHDSTREIVQALRANARAMVDAAAVSAMACAGHGEDAFGSVSEALSRLSKARNGAECGEPPASRSAENRTRAMPLDLITSCLSALMMVQACTERQYPPADVAKIIDSAVTSLRPSCSQNLPIFRDIEMCMGRIKMQILALVPTDHTPPSLPL